MSLRDLTDPAAVHSAMSTYDEMGREQFLAEYGFGPAQKYWLVHEGRYYDSKAIVGVAHLHQTGALLSGSDFTGGLSGAVRILKALGFGVVTNDEETSSNEGPPSFELLWNPHNWSWDDAEFQATREAIAATGSAPERWSTGSRWKGIEPGDRIYLFHIGSQNRGLVGSGLATSEIEPGPHWDEQRTDEAPYVDITWDALLDPQDVLHWDEIKANDSAFPSQFMSGGVKLDGKRTDALESLWQEHVDNITLGESGPSPAPGVPISYTYGRAKRRNHQRRFRALLFRHYAAECWVCGFDQVEILEAAHIVPDAKGGLATIDNGRLMCPNHHRAHDAKLFHLNEDYSPEWREDVAVFMAPVQP